MKVQCDGGCGTMLAKAHRGSASGHYCEAPACGQTRRTAYARRRFQTDPVYHAWQTDYILWRDRRRIGWSPERLGPQPHIGDYRAAAQSHEPLPRLPRLWPGPLPVAKRKAILATKGTLSRRQAAAVFGISPGGVYAIWQKGA